jgi:hypothetical protein
LYSKFIFHFLKFRPEFPNIQTNNVKSESVEIHRRLSRHTHTSHPEDRLHPTRIRRGGRARTQLSRKQPRNLRAKQIDDVTSASLLTGNVKLIFAGLGEGVFDELE